MTIKMGRPAWAHEETHLELPGAIRGRPGSIIRAFDWNQTPEGPAYWLSVYQHAVRKHAIDGEARTKLRMMADQLRITRRAA